MSIGTNDYAFGFFAAKGFWYIKKANHSTDSTKTYYGFMDKFGNFYIMELTEGYTSGSCKYYKANNNYDFDTVWASREALSYDYPDSVFNDE